MIRTLFSIVALALVFGCSKAEQAPRNAAPLIPAEGSPANAASTSADQTNQADQADLIRAAQSPRSAAAHQAGRKQAAKPKTHVLTERFEVGAVSYVRSLFVQDDNLYVGTSTGVLVVNRQTGDMVRTFSRNDGMRDPYAFVVRPGPQDSIWMGTNAGGLSVFKEGKIKNYLPKHGLTDLWVYDLAWARDGSAWIATWDGVNHVTGSLDDKANWATYNTEDGLANPWVYAIQIDSGGNVWFGTEGGLSRLDPQGHWTTWLQKDGMGAPNPRQLAKSHLSGFGSKPAGAHSHDLTTLDPTGQETYNENYVFSLLLDRQEALWIGTWGGGVARFDGKQFANLTTENGLAGNVVYAIAQGPDEAMWFGTNHGLSRFTQDGWTNYTHQDGLTGDDVYTLAVTDDNTVWVGQKGSVSKLVTVPAHG